MARQADKNQTGKQILSAIGDVLQYCTDVGARVDYPGEGGERRFRSWLSAELLQAVLGWPSKNIVVGERFDLLLLNEDQHPVATIETKTPRHKASKKEIADFEERLSGYPTLRNAYLTNGSDWQRLDIVVASGELRIVARERLDLGTASVEYAEQFFAPLQYRSSDDIGPGQIYQVNRQNAFIGTTLSRLTADLNSIVEQYATHLQEMFHGLRDGLAGDHVHNVTLAVYSQWCTKSLRVTPEHAAKEIKTAITEKGATAVTIQDALSALGLSGATADQAAEGIMALPAALRTNEADLIRQLWPAFSNSINQLCAQTAHVILARTLLYRVGEDEHVFTRQLSGLELERGLEHRQSVTKGVTFAATELIENVRDEMQNFLPTVYLPGEFDWWLITRDKRRSLTSTQRAWVRDFDYKLELLNKFMLRRLSHYQFEDVDVDIWRNIYENYLPEDERQRLGGFYTPEQLVISFSISLSTFLKGKACAA
jgi:hypothetical protein